MVNYADRTTCTLFGDGAACMLIEPTEEKTGIIDGVFHVDGEGLPHLVMKGGGSAHPATQQTLDEGWHYLYQEGRAVYKHAVTDMLNSSMEVAERNNINVADVDWFIPPPGQHAHHRGCSRTCRPRPRQGACKHRALWQHISRFNPLCIDEYKDKLKKATRLSLPHSVPDSHGVRYTLSGISDSDTQASTKILTRTPYRHLTDTVFVLHAYSIH